MIGKEAKRLLKQDILEDLSFTPHENLKPVTTEWRKFPNGIRNEIKRRREVAVTELTNNMLNWNGLKGDFLNGFENATDKEYELFLQTLADTKSSRNLADFSTITLNRLGKRNLTVVKFGQGELGILEVNDLLPKTNNKGTYRFNPLAVMRYPISTYYSTYPLNAEILHLSVPTAKRRSDTNYITLNVSFYTEIFWDEESKKYIKNVGKKAEESYQEFMRNLRRSAWWINKR